MEKHSVNFAKIDENGEILYAPLMLIIGGVKTWTNIAKIYLDRGYYPVEYSEEPKKEGFFYTSKWELVDGKCVQKWEEHEILPDETEEYALAAKILFGEVVL